MLLTFCLLMSFLLGLLALVAVGIVIKQYRKPQTSCIPIDWHPSSEFQVQKIERSHESS